MGWGNDLSNSKYWRSNCVQKFKNFFILPNANIRDRCALVEGEEVTVYSHSVGGKIRNETCEKECRLNTECKIFERIHL